MCRLRPFNFLFPSPPVSWEIKELTLTDCESILNLLGECSFFGAYGWIATERLYSRQFVSALLLRGDMADIGDRGTPAERQQVNDFNMDDNNNMVNQFWPVWYQVISAANAAVAGAESLKLPENEINPLIAEARFVRAFSYFHLVQVFGDIPTLIF
jgi:hypothetical protein